MSTSSIDTHITQIMGGISTLTDGYPTHAMPILVLLYSAIDQLSWLVADKEKHGPEDFKRWVDIYMKPEKTLNCTAEQMWAARNGILHMGTAESVNTRNGVKKLCYYIGQPQISQRDDYVFVCTESLIRVFLEAAMEFGVAIKKSEQRDLAERKIQQVLLVCGVG